MGTSGVEAFYEDTLRGVDGKETTWRWTPRGCPCRSWGRRSATPAETVVLTIDKELQKVDGGGPA